MKLLHAMKGWLVLILVLGSYHGMSQNLNGQWRGSFNSAGDVVATEGETEYVIELYIKGDKVSGYSYSYFNYPEKRYYVICRLDGTYNASSKSVVVNEEERIKGNTPPHWSDCLQTHILTFFKQGGTEKLIGRWRGYRPDGCGVGSTELERKVLTRVVPRKSTPKNPAPSTAKQKTTTQQSLTHKAKPGTGTAQRPAPKKDAPVAKKNNTRPKAAIAEKEMIVPKPQKVQGTTRSELPDITAPELPGYAKRSKNILKVIEIPTDGEFKVDFYDNGEIDGDTISVFYNNQLLLSHHRLTDKPLSLKIKLDTTREENELVMYADNLGAIPPNTALMVVTVGDKRHEVYITSTEKSSGTIRFRRKD